MTEIEQRFFDLTNEQRRRGRMASAHHRANIMNRRYLHLGVGVALTASEIRVTQLFARFER